MLKKRFHSIFSTALLFSFLLGFAQMSLHALEHEAASHSHESHAHDHSSQDAPAVAEYDANCGLCAQFVSNFAFEFFSPRASGIFQFVNLIKAAPAVSHYSEISDVNGSRGPPAV